MKRLFWITTYLLMFPVWVLASGLPYTDGSGLAPEPERPKILSKEVQYALSKASCDTGCVTDFGALLGEADGAKSYSNCKSTCFTPAYSFLNLNTLKVSIHKSDPKNQDLHYIGVVHQCVEYAREWWMINKGISFPSIDYAYQIIYLTHGFNIRTKAKFPLGRSINGTASIPPKRGDLLIYGPRFEDPNWQAGHVAVVVKVDLKKGELFVAEENYDNKKWQKPTAYARKIQIGKDKGGYRVIDLAPGESGTAKSGKILGWIYPEVGD